MQASPNPNQSKTGPNPRTRFQANPSQIPIPKGRPSPNGCPNPILRQIQNRRSSSTPCRNRTDIQTGRDRAVCGKSSPHLHYLKIRYGLKASNCQSAKKRKAWNSGASRMVLPAIL